jgi:hypothetical protein
MNNPLPNDKACPQRMFLWIILPILSKISAAKKTIKIDGVTENEKMDDCGNSLASTDSRLWKRKTSL